MSETDHFKLLGPVVQAYDKRLRKHGNSAQGVYWRSEEGQHIRFDVLAGIIPEGETGLSINDLGCGYGALFGHLADRPCLRDGTYTGYDITRQMVSRANVQFTDRRAEFILSPMATRVADYSFVSGTYNLKLHSGNEVWRDYVMGSLEALWDKSERGLAFNMLHSDGKGRQSGLYYANADEFMEFCRTRLSPHCTLTDDYSAAASNDPLTETDNPSIPLSEWTLHVKR